MDTDACVQRVKVHTKTKLNQSSFLPFAFAVQYNEVFAD